MYVKLYDIPAKLISILAYTPRILLRRVIHVKDEGEELPSNNPQVTLNMAQATEQMVVQKTVQPKILLKRVCLEN